ncbi:hypothetical protein NQ314_020151 [Rhamnusium bicolor]|uniref:Receptor ligand binding region domain-containing protein n=1 Tax=Rhamnusium bicolor TaxID=1586634 RepID=A0AAV8WLM7_9CUCU|nr:hypothetical protein NQ314_020151 [Rhamnusium bicolor]
MFFVNSDDPFSSLNSICHVLREGVVGVYGLTSPSNVHIVQSVCDAKQIPHIITHWAEPIESGIQINFYPQPKFLTQAYMDIISNFNWNEFTILYLNSESLPRLGNFIESSKTTGHIVYIENLDPDGTENYR